MRYSHQIPGASQIERVYTIVRKTAAILNKRRRLKRCRYCFKLRVPLGKCTKQPATGYDGCAEMDSAFIELKKLFKD